MQKRFMFGKNWKSFSEKIDRTRIQKSEIHLQERFEKQNFRGLRFLDIGSGSGMFSLAAINLGASQIEAFDYDRNSVFTTKAVINDWAKPNPDQTIKIYQGDILSDAVNPVINSSDLIYSWGVLHHTGKMEISIKKVLMEMKPGALFVLAIYNDEGAPSKRWTFLKKLYVRVYILRPILLFWAWYRFWGSWQIRQWLKGESPWHYWNDYAENSRAMSAWHDLKDWAGGYPFEVATPDVIRGWVQEMDCTLQKEWLVSGIANNEFLIKKNNV
jgi:2-polyprenyl-6-hydroxyphenyl methylase/3-demethylubiquinone-9 3-methyltransferase